MPAPPLLIENLDRVEVTTSDTSRSGFQLVFTAGRRGPADLVDFPLLTLPLLRQFSRVILVVTFAGTPKVLMDGFITHRELTPGATAGRIPAYRDRRGRQRHDGSATRSRSSTRRRTRR